MNPDRDRSGVMSAPLKLTLADPELRRGRTETLAFRIVDERGATVRDFDVEHTKRMHLILARRDLTGFQHLHPSSAADGTWTTRVRLDEAGSYRLFADFSPTATSRRRSPPTCASTARPTSGRCRPAPAAVTDGGYDVRLDAGRRAPGAGGRPALHDHQGRRARRDRALPRRRRPPRRAARGRPRVPARAPDATRPAAARSASPRRSRPRAATACSCSSSTTAGSRPSPSRRRCA